ncbi:hypothetical protein ACXU4B_17465 [Dyella soli]|uniref:Uncharacterized protein n=1 Tax=Dyella soli TaxID=522319 RepID=A0A4R0YK94_9GAMM|nr:hypothetical protein [Dyella soli]TCI06414.1 hypothetical protein EZM97_33550 [Dyella soli]
MALVESGGSVPILLDRTIRQRMRDDLTRRHAFHAPGLSAIEPGPAAMVVQQLVKATMALPNRASGDASKSR